MSVYFGIKKKSYETHEDRIGNGGEGSIYTLVNNKEQVAKLYKEQYRTKNREEKLLTMIQYNLSDEQLKQVVWPQDILYDNNQFVGYIMPILKNTSSLIEVYSSSLFDLRHRILVAYNLCIAINTVHNMGQVCGDLNPLNICVNLDENDKDNLFKVTLIDTDSFHITASNRTYRCEVGLGDYLAPELQRKLKNGDNLKTIELPTYTKETDLFAVAVHIFYLLMNGCHPYACAKENNRMVSNIDQFVGTNVNQSVVAPQPIDNIGDGFFPFVEKREGITIPIYAPEFESLPLNIRKLFIRTFIEGYSEPKKRVSIDEWITALYGIVNSISRCNYNSRHYYFSHNNQCPLCEIDKNINSFFEKNDFGSSVPNNNDAVSDNTVAPDNNSNSTSESNDDQNSQEGLSLGCEIIILAIILIIMTILIYSCTQVVNAENVYDYSNAEVIKQDVNYDENVYDINIDFEENEYIEDDVNIDFEESEYKEDDVIYVVNLRL
ncbi:MAG: hypothetical protein K6G11_07165 [Lachnospiraceae bacterium]|nr:hypothetical protein [Lachnospiraceae bacterium]